MKTADDRLAFAVDFAQKDLGQMRPGDWLNLRDDFAAFLLSPGQSAVTQDLGGIIATPVTSPLPGDFEVEDFRSLQGRTLNILASMADSDSTGEVRVMQSRLYTEKGDIIPSRALKKEEFEGNIRFDVLPLPLSGKGQAILRFEGSTQNMFFLILAFLLAQQPRDRIRRCPECQRLFLRIRKQAYCSRTCVNRVNKRTWRETRETKARTPQRTRRKKTKTT